MRIGDQDLQRGRNKVLKQQERSIWEKTSFVSLGIVQSVEEKLAIVKLIPSFSFEEYDMKKGFSKVNADNPIVTCLRVQDLELFKNDVVVVVFTDLDSKQAILDLQNGKDKESNFNTDNKNYHSANFGIIINKVII